MKLLFDLEALQPLGNTKFHGGGKYGEVILYRMIERGIKFTCFYNSDRWLNPEVEQACRNNGIELIDRKDKSLQEIIDETGCDTAYSAIPSVELFHTKNCHIIGTLHGLRALETPNDSLFVKYKRPLKSRIKNMINSVSPKIIKKRWLNKYSLYFTNAYKFVVVSDHTKYSVQSYFPDLRANIGVFFSPDTSGNSTEIHDAPDKGKYFFAVNGNREEKNVLRAIMAFDRLASAGLIGDMKLKITGCTAKNFRYKIKNPDRIIFTGYVSNDELQNLYANAYAFVYPSLNEGFGYPPLEAMRYGVPVISSPISSISTVLQGGALYFNPFSVEEIMSRMLMIMDPAIHDEYAEKGKIRQAEVAARQAKDLDSLIDYILAE